MIRRNREPALDACSYAGFAGRSSAQSGSRSNAEHRISDQFYCRQARTA